MAAFLLVIPAKAGIQLLALHLSEGCRGHQGWKSWIPAFAGM